MENKIQRLISTIGDHKYVSFDLFDTLMLRSVSKPEYVFDLVEAAYNEANSSKPISNFRAKRVLAERKARKANHYREVTIDYIYSFLRVKPEIKQKLEQLEKTIEINTCLSNQYMIEVFRKCREMGKDAFIITDMYLDHDTIVNILRKIGIDDVQIYLSAEIGKTKLSGELFSYVLQDKKIDAQSLIHIGDNPKTDIESPRRLGIDATERIINRHIEKPHLPNALYADYLATFIQNTLNIENLVAEDKTKALIGYSVLGPYLFEFCKWTHDYAQTNHIEKIAFVAREGYLLKNVYDVMYPEDVKNTCYIRINKNITRLPGLYIRPTVEQFLHTIPYRNEYSVEDLLNLLFVKGKDDLVDKLGVSLSDRLSHEELKSERFAILFEQIMQFIQPELEQQYNLFIAYLAQNHLDEPHLLVNNSIHGNAQKLIISILKNEGKKYVGTGIQFITSKECQQNTQMHVEGWLDSFHLSNLERYTFGQYALVFEHMLFEANGTAEILASRNGNVDAICADIGAERFNADIVNLIQDYSIRFAKNFRRQMEFDISPLAVKNFFELLICPTKEQAATIGNIKDEDFNGVSELVNTDAAVDCTDFKALGNYTQVKWPFGYLAVKGTESQLENYIRKLQIKLFLKNILEK